MTVQNVKNAVNPFGKKESASVSTVSIEEQRAIQEVQAAMVIAKKFPRDPIVSMDRILNACTRKNLAEMAVYSYVRGGANVSGPSIRLAETVAQNWGNIQFGIKELSQDNGVSVVESFAWDLETNTRTSKIFQVSHIRYTKNGIKPLTDPRDIYENIANNGARRLRACILSVIPGDVIETAVEQCDVTLAAHVDITPEGIKKMVEAFASFDVTQEMIEKRIGKRMEAINQAQMVQFKKIYASLRDGMSEPSAWFDLVEKDEKPKPAPSSTENLKKSIKIPPAAPAHAKGVLPSDGDSIDKETGEVLQPGQGGEMEDIPQ